MTPPPQPAVIVCGYGVTDTLQLTVETQRALQSAGHTFAISPPPNLLKYLIASRIRVVDLTDHMESQASYAEAYLDAVDVVVRRGATDPPAVLLVPGSPLFFDTVTRFVMETAKDRDLEVSVLPGVSPLDAFVAALGVDVTTRGLQVFDARHLVGMKHAINPDVPVLVMGIDALIDQKLLPKGTEPSVLFDAVATYIGKFHAGDQLVTLVTPGNGSAPVSVPISRFDELLKVVRPGSALFLDRVRVEQRAEESVATTS